MAKSSFEGGLRELSEDVHAYLQPGGGWGLSNAGLITDSGASLLIDTLFDRPHTERMLDAMRKQVKSAETIDILINTHANGDHCWGNELVREARSIASEACVAEMSELSPRKLALLMKVASAAARLGALGPRIASVFDAAGLGKLGSLIEAAPYVKEAFGRFQFDGIELVPPRETFRGALDVKVGSRVVHLVEAGPAHTRGDILVFVPHAKTVFTGDILFSESHPILWEGPVSNWLAACAAILDRKPEVVVPGHGPITDVGAVQLLEKYLRWLSEASREAFDAGLSVEQAANEVVIPNEFESWSEAERIVVNIGACYREFDVTKHRDDVISLFGAMARWHRNHPLRLGPTETQR